MKTILNQLFTPLLDRIGLTPIKDGGRRCGVFYKPDPCLGEGSIWVYPVGELFAVAVYDMLFKQDISIGYHHPAYLSIGTYEEPMAKLMYKGAESYTESLLGYVGQEEHYEEVMRKGVSLRCISISMTPEFQEQIAQQFSGDFQNLPDILSKLNGADTVPEVAAALKQVRTFNPSERFARAYYESKVLEILSMLMQWGEDRFQSPEERRLKAWELEKLQTVSGYLRQHFAEPVALAALARMACMSQSKLTQNFKQAHGMTVGAYIQSCRIEQAKDMLLHSDREIGQIADNVGYKLHRSFSEAFKQATGLTPSEFRIQKV